MSGCGMFARSRSTLSTKLRANWLCNNVGSTRAKIIVQARLEAESCCGCASNAARNLCGRQAVLLIGSNLSDVSIFHLGARRSLLNYTPDMRAGAGAQHQDVNAECADECKAHSRPNHLFRIRRKSNVSKTKSTALLFLEIVGRTQ